MSLALLRTLGVTWFGDAAESYRTHATNLMSDLAAGQAAAADISGILESMARDLADAQESLDARLATLSGLPALPPIALALMGDEIREAIDTAELDAWYIRAHLDSWLEHRREDLVRANRVLREISDRWQQVAAGETSGWTPPPEVAGQIGVIRVGDQLVLNVPDGAYPAGSTIVAEIDPVTGEQVVKAVGPGTSTVLYRGPADAEVVLRTGSGSDQVVLRGGVRTVIAGSGDDHVTDADVDRLPTIIGLGGNDTIRAGSGEHRIRPDSGGGRLSGGAGDDTVRTGDNQLVFGGQGDDNIRAQGGSAIVGGQGDDYLWSGGSMRYDEFRPSGASSVYGGAGDDELAARYGENGLLGGTGSDRLDSRTNEAVHPEIDLYPNIDLSDRVDGQLGHDTVVVREDEDDRIVRSAGDERVTR